MPLFPAFRIVQKFWEKTAPLKFSYNFEIQPQHSAQKYELQFEAGRDAFLCNERESDIIHHFLNVDQFWKWLLLPRERFFHHEILIQKD